MSQQTIRQQARRTAREMAERRRRERIDGEARTIALAEQVMVAIGERDAAVAATEKRAAAALRQLTDAEGLSLKEAVEWCGETLTAREATRLRRLVAKDAGAVDGGPSLEASGAQPRRLSAQVEASGAAG
ncbi:hypothetical protein [Nocardioides sp.]|uniref:hypothetical protein n=1 Tax=Nocardioides sp. TaxID=35761 RepID=UPI00261CF534|nr:hypothetical protein [Nocardioides sp.]MCW2737942.1 hypothetical protein [Nocardioides sp.]